MNILNKADVELTVRRNILEKNINRIGEDAFRAGYMRALQDIIKEKTNGKSDILLIVSDLIVRNVDETQAAKFISEHPFIFKS